MTSKVRIKRTNILIICIVSYLSIAIPVYAQSGTVNAVLFYSPTCQHCQVVINEVFPPLLDRYTERLNIIGINVSNPEGQSLYLSAVKLFNVPDERLAVPMLIVGEMVLVGSREIPDIFPSIIETGLLEGGIDWPAIPGLAETLRSANSPFEEKRSEFIGDKSLFQKIAQDPVGNSVSIAVLIAMIFSMIMAVRTILKDRDEVHKSWTDWTIPALIILGLVISGYLSYVELTQSEAYCGPVGNCNAVQQSPYAYLFDLLPIGMLGFIGYIAILIAWLIYKLGSEKLGKLGVLLGWGLVWFGMLFSLYLTFIEPFAIGATCAWCITSATIMTLLLWAYTEITQNVKISKSY